MHTVPCLQITLLGPIQAQLADNWLTHLSAKKAQALLAYLVVEVDHPHRREILAGWLWPEQPEVAARQSLRQSLLKLRQAIPESYLLTTPQTVQFNPASNYQLDVRTFSERISTWRQHLHSDLSSCGPCLACLQQAVACYRGDFLAGFFLEDSDLFEEWASLKREWLRREMLQALYQLASIHTGRGEYDAAYAYAWRQVEMDPLREEAHVQLMRVLALSGRRSEALTQYETCRTLLVKELGVTPDTETTLLYEQIRGASLSASSGKGEERQQRGEPSTPHHNLPAQLTPFVGRAVELVALADLLAKPDVRLLTILGPGGVGKTRLALEVAAKQLHCYRDGIYFVPLAAVDTPYAIIPLVADALNLIFYEVGAPQQQLCDYLRHKNTLILMDNFEHLLVDVARQESDPQVSDPANGVSMLLEFLRVAPGLKILVTSRTRLNVQGEQLYLIDGIDFPLGERVTLEEAALTSGVQLFVESARRVQASFALTEANVVAISHICRLVEGMPLAILLAAAWVEMLTPVEILAELIQQEEVQLNFDLLATDLHNVPARQRSLRAVFEHSLQLLTQRERVLFQQMSIFHGGFTRQAVQSILGTTLRVLMALVNKSLLRRQAAGRYELHELIRQYAAECLTQTPTQDAAVRNRHSAFYCALLGEQEAKLKGLGQQAAMAQIEAELENGRIAWQWAVAHEQIEQVAQAMHSLGLFYSWRRRYQEGEALYSSTVRGLQAINQQSPATQCLLAQALAWQSLFSRWVGRLEEANHLLQQSLDVLDSVSPVELDAQRVRAFILLQLGKLAEAQAEFEEGKQRYQQALALCQALNDRWGTANALAGLGEIARRAGDYQQARRDYEESLTLYTLIGDNRGSAHALEWLGYVLRDQGQFEAAEHVTRGSIALYALLDDQAKVATGQFALGWTYIFAGRFVEAYALVEKSIAICEELGLPTPTNVLGLINLELGKYHAARSQLQAKMLRTRESGNKDELSLGLDLLSYLAIAEARYADAQQLLSEGIALHREIGEHHRLTQAYAWWGYAARGLGRYAEAQHYFLKSLQMVIAQQDFTSLLFTLPGIALLLADQGEVERAIELYFTIADMPIVANSQIRKDVAGRYLDTVSAQLPPEVIVAARSRGKVGDLWSIASILLVELSNQGWATGFYEYQELA